MNAIAYFLKIQIFNKGVNIYKYVCLSLYLYEDEISYCIQVD